MIIENAILEVRRQGGRVEAVAWYDGEGDALIGEARPSRTHQRGFLEGLLVDAFEVLAFDVEGAFQWRLYSARRGLRRGLVLSMAPSDEALEAAQGDPLWMVGSLGREHLEEVGRHEEEGEVDGRALFFHGDEGRVLIEGEDGDLWGSLERRIEDGRWMLRLWDGRALGSLDIEGSDDSGVSALLAIDAGVEDALERAALEAIGVVRAVLVS